MAITNHIDARQKIDKPRQSRWGILRWRTPIDAIESPDSLKSLKCILTALKEARATMSANPERYHAMLQAASKRAELLGKQVSVNYGSVIGLVKLCRESSGAERTELLGIFGKAFDALSERKQLKVQKKLKKTLDELTLGLKIRGLSRARIPDSRPVEAIANILEEIGSVKSRKHEGGFLPNEQIDKDIQKLLLRGLFAEGIEGDEFVRLSTPARLACAKALWENGESREFYLKKMLLDSDTKICQFATEVLLTLKKGGWKMLRELVHEKDGRASSAAANKVALGIVRLGNEDAEEFKQECLSNKETRAVMIKAIAAAFDGKVISVSAELEAIVESALSERGESIDAALELIAKLKELPEDSRVYELAREGNEHSLRIIISKKPEKLKKILRQMYEDKSTETRVVRRVQKSKKKSKVKRETKTEYLWKKTVREMLSSKNEAAKEVALEFLIGMNKSATWEFAMHMLPLDELKEKADRMEAGQEKKIQLFSRMLIWALKDDRGNKIRIKALTYVKGNRRLRPKIYELAAAELGNKNANERTMRLALQIARRVRKPTNDMIWGVVELIDSMPKELGVPAIASLSSWKIDVSDEMIRDVLIARNPKHLSSTSIEDTKSIISMLPQIAPSLGEDATSMEAIRNLVTVAPGECAYALDRFQAAGCRMAETTEEDILSDAKSLITEAEANIRIGESYTMFVSFRTQQGQERASEVLWKTIIPTLYETSRNGESEKRRNFAKAMLVYLAAQIVYTAENGSGESRMTAARIVDYLPEVLEEMTKSKIKEIRDVAIGTLKSIFPAKED